MIVLNGAEEEEDDDVDDDVEEEDRSEDLGLGPQFLRACAVEMHFNISKEPLCTESCTKNAAPQIEPKTQTHTLCELAQSKCTSTFHKSQFLQKFTGKMPRLRLSPECRRTLCASLRSPKCTSAFHKSHFVRKFTGKMPRPKPVDHTLCEPAQSKCTSTFTGKIKMVKGRRPECAP